MCASKGNYTAGLGEVKRTSSNLALLWLWTSTPRMPQSAARRLIYRFTMDFGGRNSGWNVIFSPHDLAKSVRYLPPFVWETHPLYAEESAKRKPPWVAIQKEGIDTSDSLKQLVFLIRLLNDKSLWWKPKELNDCTISFNWKADLHFYNPILQIVVFSASLGRAHTTLNAGSDPLKGEKNDWCYDKSNGLALWSLIKAPWLPQELYQGMEWIMTPGFELMRILI